MVGGWGERLGDFVTQGLLNDTLVSLLLVPILRHLILSPNVNEEKTESSSTSS